MKKLISCAFNIDTASVELKYDDGSMVSIYCPRVEDQVAENRIQRAELDWLVCNEPLTYAQLIFSGQIKEYLNGTPEHTLDD